MCPNTRESIMKPTSIFAALAILASIPGGAEPATAQQPDSSQITPRAVDLNESFADPDAQAWVARFERAGRAVYDARFALLDVLSLRPGMSVADIGAGSGFFARLIAERVAPSGQVYAVDIAESLVEHMAKTADEMGVHNFHAILGGERTPRLDSNSVEAVYIMDAYHHFAYPAEMLAEIKRALRPGGELLLIEYERIPGVTPRGRLEMLRAGKDVFRREFIEAGFEFIKEVDLIGELDPSSYALHFRLP
jgi:ubiquinone/menaquinone biosynthesis C-methylase UbiE